MLSKFGLLKHDFKHGDRQQLMPSNSQKISTIISDQ